MFGFCFRVVRREGLRPRPSSPSPLETQAILNILKAEKAEYTRVRSRKTKKKSPCKRCDKVKPKKNSQKWRGEKRQDELKREELVTAGVSTRNQADKPSHSDQDQDDETSEIPVTTTALQNLRQVIQMHALVQSLRAKADTEKPATEEPTIRMEEEDKTEQNPRISCMANWLQKTYAEKRAAIEELFAEDGLDYEGFEEEEDDTGKESREEVEKVTEEQNESPTAEEALEKPEGVEAETEKATERSAERARIEQEECEEKEEKVEKKDEKPSEDEEGDEEGYEGGTEADTAEDSENERKEAQKMLDSSDCSTCCSTVALEDCNRLDSDGEMVDW